MFFQILTFLLIPCNVPFANAETLLTNGNETMGEWVDENGQKVYNNWAQIAGYNKMDQCFKQPNSDAIVSFAIILQLPDGGMNEGTGLVLCYAAQLDKNYTSDGLIANLQQRVINQKGENQLIKTCEEAKEKLRGTCSEQGPMKEECEAFTDEKMPWHGIKLGPHENGRDIMMTMSASKRSFVIPRDAFKDERLVFKLTTWKSFISSFSKSLGSGWDISKHPEFSDLQEALNSISVANDRKLRKRFEEIAFAGAYLKDNFGPWALGMDMLPREEGERILNVMVIRSECSRMAATFLLPVDTLANTSLPDIIPEPNMNISLTNLTGPIYRQLELDGITIFFGQVPAQLQNFTIELINSLIGEDDFVSIRMVVEFEIEGQNGNVRFEYRKNNDREKYLNAKQNIEPGREIVFKKGRMFHLKVISRLDTFEMSLNCGPSVNYSRGVPIPFNTRLITKVFPEGLITKVNVTNPPKELKMPGYHSFVELENKLGPGRGYLIRGNLLKDWKSVTLRLLKKNEDGSMSVILKFVVDMAADRYYLYKGSKQVENKVKPAEFEFDHQFDLHAIVYEDAYEFNINDSSIFYRKKQDSLDIDEIKIDADAEIIKNISTWITPTSPYNLNLTEEDYNRGLVFEIVGKVLDNAQDFSIDLLGTSDNEELDYLNYGKCWNDTAKQCDVVLHFHTELAGNTSVGSYFFAFSEGLKHWEKNATYPTMFRKGEDFVMRIEFLSAISYKIIVNDKIQVDKYIKSKTLEKQPNFIQINGGVMLYEEISVRKP